MPKLIGYLRNLAILDAYPKTAEDFSVKTVQGATITIFCFVLMSMLISFEVMNYMIPSVGEELFVDTSRNPNIQININLTMLSISCDYLSLDAMDSSGEQHLQIDHNIYKRRLDLQGNPIEEPKKQDITIPTKSKEDTALEIATNKTECGSCYGASFDSKKCCNTCDDVREAYRERRWAFPENPENISQCKDDNFKEKMSTAFSQGCQVYGSLIVNRVSGSFHIAPGRSFSVNHIHVHDVQPFSSTSFNTTHKIDEITFGAVGINAAAHNPLQNTIAVAQEGATMFQYHIKIVPTLDVRLNGSIIFSNQYSVTKHKKVISVISGESGMPGAFFQYELSPLMVKRTEKAKSFFHLLTSICAIIGGVYTVCGLIDSLLFTFFKIVKRMELGKQH